MTTVLNSKPRCNIMAESNTKNIRYLVSVVITVAIIFVVGIGFSLNVSAEENFIPFWIKSSAKFWVEDQISDTEFMKTLEYLINTKIINIPDKSYSEEYEKMEKRVADLEKQNQQLLDRNYANPTTSNSDLGFYINQLEQENEILEETNAELISTMEEVEVMLRNEIPNVQKLEDENKKLKEENQQLRLLVESLTTNENTEQNYPKNESLPEQLWVSMESNYRDDRYDRINLNFSFTDKNYYQHELSGKIILEVHEDTKFEVWSDPKYESVKHILTTTISFDESDYDKNYARTLDYRLHLEHEICLPEGDYFVKVTLVDTGYDFPILREQIYSETREYKPWKDYRC